MTSEEKREFIKSLVDSVKVDILSKVEAMPENWDGLELREYIKDRFADCVYTNFLQGKRKKDYKNTIRTSGAL